MILMGTKERRVQWWAYNNIFDYTGCKVSYEGIEYEGYLDGAINPCSSREGTGVDCSYCSVDFGCEGGL